MTGLAGVNPQEGGRSSDDGSSVIPKGVSVIAGADEADDAVDAWRWVGLLVVARPISRQSSIVIAIMSASAFEWSSCSLNS